MLLLVHIPWAIRWRINIELPNSELRNTVLHRKANGCGNRKDPVCFNFQNAGTGTALKLVIHHGFK